MEASTESTVSIEGLIKDLLGHRWNQVEDHLKSRRIWNQGLSTWSFKRLRALALLDAVIGFRPNEAFPPDLLLTELTKSVDQTATAMATQLEKSGQVVNRPVRRGDKARLVEQVVTASSAYLHILHTRNRVRPVRKSKHVKNAIMMSLTEFVGARNDK